MNALVNINGIGKKTDQNDTHIDKIELVKRSYYIYIYIYICIYLLKRSTYYTIYISNLRHRA